MAEIINSESNVTKEMTVKNRVEALWISPNEIVVHEEELNIVEGEVIKQQRTGSLSVKSTDTFVNPGDGQEYNTYDFFINEVQTRVQGGETLFVAVKAAIDSYKTILASLSSEETSE